MSIGGGTHHPQPTGRLQNITPQPPTTVPFPKREEGIVVFDLFLGVGTTLLSLLQTRTKVSHLDSVETSPIAREVEQESWAGFVTEYPQLCSRDTFRQSHGAIPNDAQLIREDVCAALPRVDLITAGWECQGHCRARQGKSLQYPRSILFFDLVRIITLCQQKNNPQS